MGMDALELRRFDRTKGPEDSPAKAPASALVLGAGLDGTWNSRKLPKGPPCARTSVRRSDGIGFSNSPTTSMRPMIEPRSELPTPPSELESHVRSTTSPQLTATPVNWQRRRTLSL